MVSLLLGSFHLAVSALFLGLIEDVFDGIHCG